MARHRLWECRALTHSYGVLYLWLTGLPYWNP